MKPPIKAKMKLLALHWRLLPEVRPELVPVAEAQPPSDLGYSPMTTLTWTLSILATQYFLVCSLNVVLQVAEQWQGALGARLQKLRNALTAAELTVNIAPMLSVLVLTSQMWAMLLSEGRDDPPARVRVCIQVATVACVLQTVLALVAPAIGGEDVEVDDDVAAVRLASPGLQMLSMAITFVLSTATACVCLGILGMPMALSRSGSSALAAESGGIPPSVAATVQLTFQFLFVHLALAVVQSTCGQMRTPLISKLLRVLRLAASTVFLAPMLCVLFIAARVRALQVNPPHGQVQPWAALAFHVCVVAILVQTLMALIVPFLPGGDASNGSAKHKGDVEIRFQACTHGLARVCFALLHWLPSLTVLVGVIVVFASFFSYGVEHETSPPAVPPTIRCVVCLTALFIPLHLCLRHAISLRAALREPGIREPREIKRLVEVLDAAVSAVKFSPMLAILFVALRLRAQQITRSRGAPQGWAQDMMFLCTFCVILEVVCCSVGAWVGMKAGGTRSRLAEARRDDNAKFRTAVVWAQVVLRATICAGAIAICVALFALTGATAGTPGILSR